MTDKTLIAELGLINGTAEVAVLAAMRRNEDIAPALAEALDANDFFSEQNAIVFEAIGRLLRGIEVIDDASILAECRRVAKDQSSKISISGEYLETLYADDMTDVAPYVNTLQRLSWLRRAASFAFWMVDELQDKPNPESLYAASQEHLLNLQPVSQTNSFVYGWDTEKMHADIIRKERTERAAGLVGFSWPWRSWTSFIRPLMPGMVGMVAAPDGQGKTTYLEQIAEHWAQQDRHVVYVHLEDDISYKLNRRKARWSGVDIAAIEDDAMTDDERERVQDAGAAIAGDLAHLHYYHAPGKSMADIIRELESRIAEKVCNAVVFDYIDKCQPSRAQVATFGHNTWERQAHDMEALKSFAERNRVAVITATQGNKAMQNGGTQTRQAIQGSGQKSQKSQLVIILTRDMVGPEGLTINGEHVADEGEYSPIVNVRVDKQNRGRTGNLRQYLKGAVFTIRDFR